MKYVLMHKNITVAELSIDDVHGNISSVEKIYNPEHLPLGTFYKGKTDRKELNDWWRGRSIPASRNGLKEMLYMLGESDIMALVIKSYGLSLSDHYWVKPEELDITWDDVNFFDNEFSEDIGSLLFGGEIPNKIDFRSPDNTSDGWLKKRWKISNGDRILIKGGSGPFQQEPFNEVIASKLMNRLGIESVPYNIVWQEGYPYSVCKNFVTKDTELIPAYHLMKIKKQPNHQNTYQHFISCCEDIGLDAVPFLDKMLTADYILVNEDRHFNNFGLIRNPETLQFEGFAPIYDTGTSLCYNRNERQFNHYESKPFYTDHNKQLKLVASLDWLDIEKAFSVLDSIDSVLRESVENGFIPPERIMQLETFVQTRLEHIWKLKDSKTKNNDIEERVSSNKDIID